MAEISGGANSFYLINELDTIGKYEIIQEGVASLNGKPKVKLKSVLQTANEVNKNKRLYRIELLRKGIEQLRPYFESRTLVGELDHPVPTGNTTTDAYRQTVVLYKKVSHLITNIWIEGNVIYGDIETTLTEHGYNMAGLVLDGVKVGFSLRAVGRLVPVGDHVEARDPFYAITYDCVSRPSHASARLIEVVSSNVQLENTHQVIQENVALDRTDIIQTVINPPTTEQKSTEQLAEELLQLVYENAPRKMLEAKLDEIVETYLSLTEPLNRDIQTLIDEYLLARTNKIRELIARIDS